MGDVAIDIRQISRRFGTTHALDGVSIRVAQGEIHALLGPNGAGKTTLLRILTGLVQADAGEILILGTPMEELGFRGFRKLFGLVPSGDRSFYLRLSGFENLLFFGRLIGLRKDRAVDRARECLEAVGLQDAAEKSVGLYSHGMQKRLSVARALLGDPLVLFIDEATHDLDPEGALTVQSLVADSMGQRAAVIWATQRLDEIRGFADHVTLLDRGHVRFDGTVPQLMAVAVPRRYVVQLLGRDGPVALESARAALGALGELEPGQDGDREHFVIHVSDSVTLGDALAAMMAGGISVLACREERSGLENAFLQLVRSDQA